MNDTQAIADWLIDGARAAPTSEAVLAEFCDRLLGGGLPIWRVGLFIITLHPQIMGQRFLWTCGQPIDSEDGSFEAFQTEAFRRSPIRYVIDNRVPLRRKLADEDCPLDFSYMQQLKEQGVTDYFVVPLFFADGVVHGANFATREPSGFTDQQIADLSRLVPPLTRVIEARARYQPKAKFSTRCNERRVFCSILTLAPMPVHACLRDKSGAATRLASTQLSGCRTCEASRSWPISYHHKLSSMSSIAILIVRSLQSSSMAAKFSSIWETGCWLFLPLPRMAPTAKKSARPLLPRRARRSRR